MCVCVFRDRRKEWGLLCAVTLRSMRRVTPPSSSCDFQGHPGVHLHPQPASWSKAWVVHGGVLRQSGSDTHYLSYFTGWNSVTRPHPTVRKAGSPGRGGEHGFCSTGKQVLSIVGTYVEASNQCGSRQPWKTS